MTAPDAARERQAFLLEPVGLVGCPVLLAEAMNATHDSVPMLVAFAQACQHYAVARRLVE